LWRGRLRVLGTAWGCERHVLMVVSRDLQRELRGAKLLLRRLEVPKMGGSIDALVVIERGLDIDI